MARLTSETNAAKRLGLPLATFRQLVADGRLPKPIDEFGLFDMKALDAALDRLSGLGSATNALDAWRGKHAAR
jgi:hypothetical protein